MADSFDRKTVGNSHRRKRLLDAETTGWEKLYLSLLGKKLKRVDAEMASILRDNWDALTSVVREGERDAKARAEFNSSVATALDALVAPAPHKEGA